MCLGVVVWWCFWGGCYGLVMSVGVVVDRGVDGGGVSSVLVCAVVLSVVFLVLGFVVGGWLNGLGGRDVGVVFGGLEGVEVLSASEVGCVADGSVGVRVRCVDLVVEFVAGDGVGVSSVGGVFEGRVVLGEGVGDVLWLVPNGVGVVGEGTVSVGLTGVRLYEVLSDDESLGLGELHKSEHERLLGLKVDLLDEELGVLEGLE